jgi:hypothetical protein
MKNIATFRNLCVLAGILLIAYAVYGVFSGEVAVFRMTRRGGPRVVHDGLVPWAALGWVSLAVAAFLMPSDIAEIRSPGPRKSLARVIGPALLFLALGFCVLGALGIVVAVR